jgi:xanthine dehydrogenase accessory factor
MSDWLNSAVTLLKSGKPCVLVTIVEAEGSTPREAGAKMLVHAGAIVDSIGGGHLELKAIEQARSMLDAAAPPIITSYALGPSLGQCCGGRIHLMLELLDLASLAWLRRWEQGGSDLLITDLRSGAKKIESDHTSFADGVAVRLFAGAEGEPCYVVERMKAPLQHLYIFGAGHVGRALVHVLDGLPYRIRWFDERAEMFPADLPANVKIEASADARQDVASAVPGTMFLVMTHSHALDFEICEQVLRRADFAFLGLIGSATKLATFERRLRLRGHSDAAIRRLICPIGLPSVTGKAPAAVAISVAGQLLTLSQALGRQARPAARRKKA